MATASVTRDRNVERHPYTFLLDRSLVDRARGEIDDTDMIRSIEAAIAAALDYQLWIREVARGDRDVLG